MEYYGQKISDLPDNVIFQLMTARRRSVPKDIQAAAKAEWTRRVNEQALKDALERQKEIMEYGKN